MRLASAGLFLWGKGMANEFDWSWYFGQNNGAFPAQPQPQFDWSWYNGGAFQPQTPQVPLPTNVMRQDLELQGQSYAMQDRGAPTRGVPAPPPLPQIAQPYIPGPNYGPKGQERLPTGTKWLPDAVLAASGVIPPLPAPMGDDVAVASELSTIPPLPIPRPVRMANVPFPRPRPAHTPLQPVQAAANAPRPPMSIGRLVNVQFPTSANYRPQPSGTPLRISVNSGGSSSGGGSQPAQRFEHNGKEVRPQVINWFNPDAPDGGAFEKRTVYR